MTPGEAELAERELTLARDALHESSLLLDEARAGAAVSRMYTFVARCREIVDEALALGPDEADPPPDV